MFFEFYPNCYLLERVMGWLRSIGKDEKHFWPVGCWVILFWSKFSCNMEEFMTFVGYIGAMNW